VATNIFDQPRVRSGSCSVMTMKYRLDRNPCAREYAGCHQVVQAPFPGEVEQSGEQKAVGIKLDRTAGLSNVAGTRD
jgi:hypothetical protein